MAGGAEELVYCRKTRKDPDLAPSAVMVSVGRDLDLLKKPLEADKRPVARFFSSRIYQVTTGKTNVSLIGPLLGAPYAVMVLEKLRVLGVREVLFLGWCGAIVPGVHIGDVVIPNQGVIGEGTSAYYGGEKLSSPGPKMLELIEACSRRHSLVVHKGAIWSTDAPYRETRQRVMSLQREGILGVDMETSALFTAGRFRNMSVGALLVVSDELGTLEWVPGFSGDGLKKARRIAAQVVKEICQKMK